MNYETKLVPVSTGEHFLAIIGELQDDESKFLCNLPIILDAFKNNKMFTLQAIETDQMYKDQVCCNPIFIQSYRPMYNYPAFLIVSDNDVTRVDIIWVHTRARRQKIGSTMCKLANITSKYCPLPDSLPFWESVGI